MTKAFFYGVFLQWKLDFRNKGVLLTYYVIPLVFFGFMGMIFTTINPVAKETLIQSMCVFGVTMGAILGAPTPLVELYGSEIKKAYKVGGIPLWVPVINNFSSAFIHLLLMSMVICFTAPAAFHAKVPESMVVFMLLLMLFIIVSLAFGTALGLLIKSVSKLTMLSQLIFLPSLMLSGAMFPANMLPEALQRVGEIFPATWALALMTKEAVQVRDLVPLLVMLVLAMGVCVFALRKNTKE